MNLYESPALRAVTGPAIRPGGLTLTARAAKICRLPMGSLVLDLGCGSGATVRHLRQCHGLRAVGVDLSWPLLIEGRREDASIALVQGRAEALPIADGRIAAIFSECVLSLLSDPMALLAEWRRVLAPEGLLVVSDLYTRAGCCTPVPASAPSHGCLDGVMPQEALLGLLHAAGFTVMLWEDHTPLLKQLAARLVWEHGSLSAFWEAAGFGCGGGRSAAGGKPGYFLMLAAKGGADRG